MHGAGTEETAGGRGTRMTDLRVVVGVHTYMRCALYQNVRSCARARVVLSRVYFICEISNLCAHSPQTRTYACTARNKTPR